jgi:hypothetical protein
MVMSASSIVSAQSAEDNILSVYKDYYAKITAANSIDEQFAVDKEYKTKAKVQEMTEKMPKTDQEKTMFMAFFTSMIKPMYIAPTNLKISDVEVNGDSAEVCFTSSSDDSTKGTAILKKENNLWKVEETSISKEGNGSMEGETSISF